jgi:F-type H+-transporting ATPase subunit alpha
MKKVAGTLKLDQAQYRELEAFSKFGSDLDTATMAVLEKGKRNVEILKQDQYSPMTVGHQIAIIYCGSKGLVKNVPVNRIRDFQTEFLHFMDEKHPKTLKELERGILNDDITKILEVAAKNIADRY